MASVTSSASRGGGVGGKSLRRIWTMHEEKVLLASLKELVAKNWKTDNGFRVGYLGKLEDALKEAFPGTDLKGIPHITSKIATWKRYHNSLTQMLLRTGIGLFPDGAIDCKDDDLWNAVLRDDTNARSMRFKTWPFFYYWCEIFGKDRANGLGAEDVMQAVNVLVNEDNMGQPSVTARVDDFINVGGKNCIITEDEITSVNQSGNNEPSMPARKKGTKRKIGETTESLVDLVGELCSEVKGTFSDIAKGMMYEHNNGERRQRLFSMLDELEENFTTAEKHDAGVRLARDKNLLEYFFGLPPNERYGFVERVLHNMYN